MLAFLRGHLQLAVGVFLAVGMIGTGILTRTIVRSSPLQWDDFCMGLELTLGAISSMLTYLLVAPAGISQTNLLLLLILSFWTFIAQIAMHQGYKSGGWPKWGQVVVMGGVSNILGIGLFFTFGYLIKG
jgi:hypothetical protein